MILLVFFLVVSWSIGGKKKKKKKKVEAVLGSILVEAPYQFCCSNLNHIRLKASVSVGERGSQDVNLPTFHNLNFCTPPDDVV